MFAKQELDALFKELEADYGQDPDYESMLREVHYGVALSDVGRPLEGEIDPTVAGLVKRHRGD